MRPQTAPDTQLLVSDLSFNARYLPFPPILWKNNAILDCKNICFLVYSVQASHLWMCFTEEALHFCQQRTLTWDTIASGGMGARALFSLQEDDRRTKHRRTLSGSSRESPRGLSKFMRHFIQKDIRHQTSTVPIHKKSKRLPNTPQRWPTRNRNIGV